LGTTIDQIPEGIVLVGRDGRLVTMNRAARAFTCEESRGLVSYGNPVMFDLRSPNGAPLSFDDYPLVRALRWGEVTLGRQLLVRTADGRMVPILSNAAPVYDERGQIAGATNLVQDITPMKEVERLREEWGSVVVHDLKQPVNAISLEVQALLGLMRDHRQERVQHGLKRIQRSVARLDRMIGDLLSASLLEAHRLPLEPQVVDVASLITGWSIVFEAR
jgi:signal transduction histidine kinase